MSTQPAPTTTMIIRTPKRFVSNRTLPISLFQPISLKVLSSEHKRSLSGNRHPPIKLSEYLSVPSIQYVLLSDAIVTINLNQVIND